MQQVKLELVRLGNYYGRELTLEVVNMMAEDLQRFSEEEILAALKEYRGKNRFFPMPCQIAEIILARRPHPIVAQVKGKAK